MRLKALRYNTTTLVNQLNCHLLEFMQVEKMCGVEREKARETKRLDVSVQTCMTRRKYLLRFEIIRVK